MYKMPKIMHFNMITYSSEYEIFIHLNIKSRIDVLD